MVREPRVVSCAREHVGVRRYKTGVRMALNPDVILTHPNFQYRFKSRNHGPNKIPRVNIPCFPIMKSLNFSIEWHLGIFKTSSIFRRVSSSAVSSDGSLIVFPVSESFVGGEYGA